jgi:cupin fold WbuC family metalloprotein
MTIDLFTDSFSKGDEVLIAKAPVVRINKDTIEELCKLAEKNNRKRMRLCTHRSINDSVHEMFITLHRDSYIRPHKHLDKAESLLVLKGSAKFLTFDRRGSTITKTEINNFDSGAVFYHKMDKSVYHSILVKSKYLSFLEITKGPLRREDTVFAPWAPSESNKEEVKKFLEKIKKSV